MTLKSTLLVPVMMLALFTLSSCNQVPTQDGKIPAEFVEEAMKYNAIYSGVLEEVQTQMSVFTDSDGVMSVNFDRDILGADCGSSVGELRIIDANMSKGKLKSAKLTFTFDPGVCSSDSKLITVNLKTKKSRIYSDRIEAKIKLETRMSMTPDIGSPLCGPPTNDPSCFSDTSVSISGSLDYSSHLETINGADF